MSKKVSTYFPTYQLRGAVSGDELVFCDQEGNSFSTKIPVLGMTETQKFALKVMCWRAMPPVVSISHRKPDTLDPRKDQFPDPKEPHRTYFPYAVVTATVQCLGEEGARELKMCFCNVEYHEDAKGNTPARHARDKEVYVVPS